MPTKSLVKLAEEETEDETTVADGQPMQMFQSPRESRVRLKWDDRLEQLKAFKTRHGHVDVPRSYVKDPSLGTFVCNQRQTYKRMNEGKGPSMDRSRVVQLNELGFKWKLKHKDQPGLVDTDDEGSADGDAKPAAKVKGPKPKPLSWEAGIEQLKEFQLVNGNSSVPHIYAANQPLGNFVKSIRQNYKNLQKGKENKLLTDPRIFELQSMGFKLQVRQREPWEQRFQELRQYVAKNGNCEVAKHTPLGIWILNQRSQFKLMLKKKPSHMSEERINLLNSIGFDWRVPIAQNGIQAGQVYVYSGRGRPPKNATVAGNATAAASMPSDAELASALAYDEKPVKTEEDEDDYESYGDASFQSSAPSLEQPDYQAANSAIYESLAAGGDLNSFDMTQQFALKPSPGARRVSEDSTTDGAAQPYTVASNSQGFGTSYVPALSGFDFQGLNGFAQQALVMPGFDFQTSQQVLAMSGFGDSYQQFAQAEAPAPAPAADMHHFPTADAFVDSLLNFSAEDFMSDPATEDSGVIQI